MSSNYLKHISTHFKTSVNKKQTDGQKKMQTHTSRTCLVTCQCILWHFSLTCCLTFLGQRFAHPQDMFPTFLGEDPNSDVTMFVHHVTSLWLGGGVRAQVKRQKIMCSFILSLTDVHFHYDLQSPIPPPRNRNSINSIVKQCKNKSETSVVDFLITSITYLRNL